MWSNPEYVSPPNASDRSRSLGVKLLVVCILAMVMTFPALFVAGVVGERTGRAAEVVQQVTASSGGQQTFLGPTLAVPYAEYAHSVYLIFPATGSAVLRTVTEELHRSLFRVPVFQAEISFDAVFDLATVSDTQVPRLDWANAQIVVGVSDPKGALADATLTTGGKTLVLSPSDKFTIQQDENDKVRLALLGTKIDAAAKPNAKFSVTSSLRFSGAQRVAVLSYAKSTHLTASGDWPSPGFDGGFLPVRRTVSRNGFKAEWSVPFIARGVRAEGPADSMRGLEATAAGISFIEMADAYQSVSRSLKYALLFLGLVFLSYFVFEVTTGKRVHPAQYVLVGIAQTVFYLLLLSLAERIGFDWSFALAGASTAGLLSVNAAWVFMSRLQGARALIVFSLLYALIYMLLRMEDNALLAGAIASFLAISVVMYLTRKIDWYSPFAGTGQANR